MINLDSECIILATNPINDSVTVAYSTKISRSADFGGTKGTSFHYTNLQKLKKNSHFSFSSDFCCLNPRTFKGRSMSKHVEAPQSSPHLQARKARHTRLGLQSDEVQMDRFRRDEKSNQPAFFPSKSIKFLDLS